MDTFISFFLTCIYAHFMSSDKTYLKGNGVLILIVILGIIFYYILDELLVKITTVFVCVIWYALHIFESVGEVRRNEKLSRNVSSKKDLHKMPNRKETGTRIDNCPKACCYVRNSIRY